METIIKMFFWTRTFYFSHLFSVDLFIYLFICILFEADMKLWSSSCKIIHCLSVPFNNKTFL